MNSNLMNAADATGQTVMNAAGASGRKVVPLKGSRSATIQVSSYISVNGEFAGHLPGGRAKVRSNGRVHQGKLLSNIPTAA